MLISQVFKYDLDCTSMLAVSLAPSNLCQAKLIVPWLQLHTLQGDMRVVDGLFGHFWGLTRHCNQNTDISQSCSQTVAYLTSSRQGILVQAKGGNIKFPFSSMKISNNINLLSCFTIFTR